MKLVFSVCLAVFLGLAGRGEAVAEDQVIFEYRVRDTVRTSGRFSTLVGPGRQIRVDWGDGTQEIFSGEHRVFEKDYGEAVDATVRIYGRNEMMLTGIRDRNANMSFDIEDMPAGLRRVNITGSNEVKGELREMSPVLEEFLVLGSDNDISGEITDLPADMWRFLVRGRTEISGDVAELPRTLREFGCRDGNTLTGDAADLPRGLEYFDCRGKNTVGGDVSGLPDSLGELAVYGNNALSGDIADLPRKLTDIRIGGNHEVKGDLMELPGGVIYLHIDGGEELRYTAGRDWADGMRQIVLNCELTTEEVDDLLIDLSKAEWIEGRPVRFGEKTAPRSDRSDDAVAKLREKEVRVDTN